MSFHARRRPWRDLLVGIAGSLLAAAVATALFTTCSEPASLHMELRLGAAAGDSASAAHQ